MLPTFLPVIAVVKRLVANIPPVVYVINISTCNCYRYVSNYCKRTEVKAVQGLHQNHWQFICHQIWRKRNTFYSVHLKAVKYNMCKTATQK